MHEDNDTNNDMNNNIEIIIQDKRLLEYKYKTQLQYKIDHKEPIDDKYFSENFDEWYLEYLDRQYLIRECRENIKKQIETHIPTRTCGVYSFMTMLGKRYADSTTDIRDRPLYHIQRNIDPVAWIYVLEVRDVKLARDIEKDMIKNIMPELNKYPH